MTGPQLLESQGESSPMHLPARKDAADEMEAFVRSLRPFWGRALLYVVLLFVGIAVIWAWWGKVDVVASAPFRLVPLGKVKTLQASRGGEIQHIGVSEGDRIAEGQLLFKLKSWETWADLRELEQAEMAFQQAEYDVEEVLPQRTELNRETIASFEKRLAVLQRLMVAHQNALNDYHADVSDAAGSGNSSFEAELQA